ncbi:hypothetical protein [Microcystis aeruginosa]|uniref:hypothetical protein n=1 Tax=Microcystis aeruginosa TaxID=1126 RepID=UPI00123071C4|nr:hypothetical protein [Microcystis aeruginosa]GCA91246.1 hypothetical protein MiTa_04614 [Microcystis aeruginosa NIES-4264]
MKRKIKLMAEYNYSPFWDMETADNLDLDELPLSSSIQKKLSNWAEIYNQIINWDNPADSHFFDAVSQDNFEREGVNIWRQLQEELSPNYQIFYFSEKQQRLLTPEDASEAIREKEVRYK